MGELTSHEIAAARRHIIKRPRLTRLLDETTARIILLVAPAGYGKTTLAREWLEESGQLGLWYQARPSSTDVAALASDLADALERVTPVSRSALDDYLASPGTPEDTASLLARDLVGNVQGWPHDAWLILDDYHLVEEADGAQRFISSLAASCPVQILVTSRTRPRWITARQLVYGEVFEVGQTSLAMTHDEAREVLPARPRDETSGLLALAEGWPAVITLASFTSVSPPDAVLPDALYRFLADEIVASADASVRNGLAKLAAAPKITTDVSRLLLARDADDVVEQGVRLGLLVREGLDRFEMHPLLRDFFERREWHRSHLHIRKAFRLLAGFHLSRGEWDEALGLIERLDDVDILCHFFDLATESLLRQGRLETIARSISVARSRSIQASAIDLADAEVAFRYGQYVKALHLALHAAIDAGASNKESHAWYLAGQCASFLDDPSSAFEYYTHAEAVACSDTDLRDALWGQLTAALISQISEAPRILQRLEALKDDSPEAELRLAAAAASTAVKTGGSILRPLAAFQGAQQRAPAAEPVAQSSFYHSYAYLLVLNARYEEALSMASREVAFIDDHSLAFAAPHALHLYAAAVAGLRRFSQAMKALHRIQAGVTGSQDVYLAMNAAALEIRILLAVKDARAATELGQREWPHVPSPSVLGELFASLGMAHACTGDADAADRLCRNASELTPSLEVRVLVACARAIVSDIQDSTDTTRAAEDLFSTVLDTGNVDSFVWAYRAYPKLLTLLGGLVDNKALQDIVSRSHDSALAHCASPRLRRDVRRRGDSLTPREQDVLELLARGISNREIASVLYISESTVKVHVRNVLGKLGARSRTEAAAMFASELS